MITILWKFGLSAHLSASTSQDSPGCPLTAMECEHFSPKALEPDHLSLLAHPLLPPLTPPVLSESAV